MRSEYKLLLDRYQASLKSRYPIKLNNSVKVHLVDSSTFVSITESYNLFLSILTMTYIT